MQDRGIPVERADSESEDVRKLRDGIEMARSAGFMYADTALAALDRLTASLSEYRERAERAEETIRDASGTLDRSGVPSTPGRCVTLPGRIYELRTRVLAAERHASELGARLAEREKAE
jgi:hypothetical protein